MPIIEPAARPRLSRFMAASVMVDASGAPRVLYHGTREKFTAFSKDAIAHFGFHVGTLQQAKTFGPIQMPLYVAIANRIRLPDLGTWHFESIVRNLANQGLALSSAEYERARHALNQGAELRKILQENGYDGIVYANRVEGVGDSYIVFEPSQLKSANANNGDFDTANDDIRFSLPDEEECPPAPAG